MIYAEIGSTCRCLFDNDSWKINAAPAIRRSLPTCYIFCEYCGARYICHFPYMTYLIRAEKVHGDQLYSGRAQLQLMQEEANTICFWAVDVPVTNTGRYRIPHGLQRRQRCLELFGVKATTCFQSERKLYFSTCTRTVQDWCLTRRSVEIVAGIFSFTATDAVLELRGCPGTPGAIIQMAATYWLLWGLPKTIFNRLLPPINSFVVRAHGIDDVRCDASVPPVIPVFNVIM